MSSLWGSKKKDDDAEHEDEQQNGGESGSMARRSGESRREPTERDRLLPSNPRPPHNDGYLDPDDPAVSRISREEMLEESILY